MILMAFKEYRVYDEGVWTLKCVSWYLFQACLSFPVFGSNDMFSCVLIKSYHCTVISNSDGSQPSELPQAQTHTYIVIYVYFYIDRNITYKTTHHPPYAHDLNITHTAFSDQADTILQPINTTVHHCEQKEENLATLCIMNSGGEKQMSSV